MAFSDGVYGSAESAQQLAAEFKSSMVAVWTSCDNIKRACGRLSGVWDDEGVREAEDTISQINRRIENSTEDYRAVYQAILAYADFLARH